MIAAIRRRFVRALNDNNNNDDDDNVTGGGALNNIDSPTDGSPNCNVRGGKREGGSIANFVREFSGIRGLIDRIFCNEIRRYKIKVGNPDTPCMWL